MKMYVTATGFKELDKALAELPKAAAKRTLQRTLLKAGQPIADAASANAPVDTGELRDSVKVGTKLGNNVGKAEYAAVMKSGGSKSQAVAALRGARRAAAGGTFAVAFVGPTKAKTRKDAIKRIVQEFGSVKQSPRPYLRPAWDSQQRVALDIARKELGNEIIQTAKRIGKSKRATAAAKSGASIAAMMAFEAGV